MSNIEKEDVIVPIGPPNTHAEAAQLRITELHQWREQIPRLEIPETADATRRLSSAASVPPAFIELR